MSADSGLELTTIEIPRDVGTFDARRSVDLYRPGGYERPASAGAFLERVLVERAAFLLETELSPLRSRSDWPSAEATAEDLATFLPRFEYLAFPPALLSRDPPPPEDYYEVARALATLRDIVPTAAPSEELVRTDFEARREIWTLRAERAATERSQIAQHPDVRGKRWQSAIGEIGSSMQRDYFALSGIGRQYSGATAVVAFGTPSGRYLGHAYRTRHARTREYVFHSFSRAPSVLLGSAPGPAFHFADRMLDAIVERYRTVAFADPDAATRRAIAARRDAKPVEGGGFVVGDVGVFLI